MVRDAAAPSWLTTPAIYGGPATMRVFADDTCEPASFWRRARRVLSTL